MPGTHYVNVIDANGCSSSTDSVLILQNDSISISSTETDISCYGLLDGSVQIDVLSGGFPPFEYSENNGQTFKLQIYLMDYLQEFQRIL